MVGGSGRFRKRDELREILALTIQAMVLSAMALGRSDGLGEAVDPGEMERRRAAVLEYITDLSEGNSAAFKGSISGQNCY